MMPTKWMTILATVAALAAPALAQQQLEDIPDPDPQKQKEALRLGDDLEVTLFASDPDIAKPIQMNWDAQGRLWVATSSVYPQIRPGEVANDKIIVLEDTNGDGKADKRTVFADGLLIPTGVIPGHGGAYVANSTELLHLKDTDGDGKADERRVVLSGFGTEDTHHIIHTFRWGPDGALYFNQSIYIHSHVETPWGPRRLLAGGIWRLQPDDLRLEVYSRGWINAWGHIFDPWGQSFVTDGAGHDGINYTFPGAAFATARNVERTLRGLNPGQPKHSGLEIVTGRHFPESWQGNLITNDFRGNRVNRFAISESGSGYVSRQGPDVITTSHVAFRPVDAQMGPDGALYIADWYNPIIQHGEVDFRDERRDREHGRIWRITHKDRRLVDPPQLVDAPVAEVLDALKLPEQWTRLQAKRVLAEKNPDDVLPALESWVAGLDPEDENHAQHLLEALWVHQSLGEMNRDLLGRVLTTEDHRARAAAVRVLSHWHEMVGDADTLLGRAVEDEHPRVRLEAVNALRLRDSAEAARLAMRAVDQEVDEFLDYALWLTARRLKDHWLPQLQEDPRFFGESLGRAVFAVHAVQDAQALQPLVELYRRGQLGADEQAQVVEVIAAVGGSDALTVVLEQAMTDADRRPELLAALVRAARDRDVAPAADKRAEILDLFDADRTSDRVAAARLAGLWKVGEAREALTDLATDADTVPAVRAAAMEGLARMQDEPSKQRLVALTEPQHETNVRLAAIVGLAMADLNAAAERVADVLAAAEDNADQTAAVFDAFYTRQEGPALLREALQGGSLPPEVASVGIRRISVAGQALPEVEDLLREVGELGAVAQSLTEQQVAEMVDEVREHGDPNRGERIYRREQLMCMNCHAIAGAGGNLGPDLISLGTAAPAELIIEQVLQPSETIKEGYHTVAVTTNDGRVVTGLLVRETEQEVVVRDADAEEVSIPVENVASQEVSPVSLMPPGLTASLTRDEFVDMIRFLTELGRDGPFKVGSEELARRWRYLEPSEAATEMIVNDGVGGIVVSPGQFAWSPAYSRVSGDLDLEEVPVVGEEGRYQQRFRVLRFDLDVTAGGEVALELNNADGARMWVGEESVSLDDRRATLELPRGEHAVFVAISESERESGDIRVRVHEPEDSQGRAQVVGGP